MTQTIINEILFYLLRVALALAILWIGRYLARYVRGLVQRLVARPQVEQVLSPTLARLLTNVVYFGLFGVVIALALVVLGVPVNLVLALGSIVFILAALALNQSLSNLAATVIFFAFQPFRRGEVVETLGKTGIVQEIQLFNTILFTGDQRFVSLSNSEIQSGGVTNHSRNGIIRNEVNFTLSYQADLEQVRRIILALVAQDQRIVADPAPSIAVLELADRGVRLAVYCMSTQPDGWAVSTELRERIKNSFDAEGIPFARQEVHIDANPVASGIGSITLDSERKA